MFTGIIDHTGEILSTERRGDARLGIGCRFRDIAVGESIAVNGVCLTVTELLPGGFGADLSAETLSRTAPRWEVGQPVNLERALTMDSRLSGHLVSGHVDGLAAVVDIRPSGDSHVFCCEAPAGLARFIAPKGSVTLDGVSLTVNQVEGARFFVNIIPHTFAHTTLGKRKPGDALNLEADMIARYVERLLKK